MTVCIQVFEYIRTYVCAYAHAHAHTPAHTPPHTCTHMDIYLHMLQLVEYLTALLAPALIGNDAKGPGVDNATAARRDMFLRCVEDGLLSWQRTGGVLARDAGAGVERLLVVLDGLSAFEGVAPERGGKVRVGVGGREWAYDSATGLLGETVTYRFICDARARAHSGGLRQRFGSPV